MIEPARPLSTYGITPPPEPPPAPPPTLHVIVDAMPEISVTVPPLEFPESLPVTGTFWQAIQPVSGPLTDAQLRATSVPVSGTFWQAIQPVSGPLTDAQLRATSVPVSGTFWQAIQPVSGPLTDAQLRATSVPVSGTFWQATQPVSGPLTDAQLRATSVPVSGTFWQATQPVSGPLTDAQLRATSVPVSGTFWQATQPVSGPLTDAQLRATPVPVCPRTPETWIWMMPSAAASAGRQWWELYNDAGSGKVIRILGIYPIVDADTAVTGVVGIELNCTRLSAPSTIGGGNNWTTSGSWTYTTNGAIPADTANAAMPSSIKGWFFPTGTNPGSSGSDVGVIASCWIMPEESSGSMAYVFQGQTNILGSLIGEAQQITLRPGEGARMLQGGVSSVGSLRFRIVFTIE